MKILFLLLLFFLIFWYYRKKKISRKEKSHPFEVEMRICHKCGTFFSSPNPIKLYRDTEIYFFCSEQCLKEFQERGKGQWIIFFTLILVLFFFSKGFASKIYYYENPETGEKFFSNVPLNGNFKIYLKLPQRKSSFSGQGLIKFKSNFNDETLASKFQKIFEEVAKEFNLDPHLLKAMAKVESNFNPKAVSPKGAMGVMQLIPSTARLVGVSDPFDPIENIYGGAKYLRWLLDEFRDLKLSLAAYNAGPEAVRQYKGIPPYPETINYVKNVLYYYDLLKKTSLP